MARNDIAPSIVSREAWLAARRELLQEEKGLTRQRDALNDKRRTLPPPAVDPENVESAHSRSTRV